MLMEYAVMRFQPDLIVWLVTLESLPDREQLDPPLLHHNAARVRDLIARYRLDLDPADPRLIDLSFLERTLVGQRRALADWWRLQAYGIAWANTGIDQLYPEYTPRRNDFDEDTAWKGFDIGSEFDQSDLAFETLTAAHTLAGDNAVPLLLVNEPIYIADGENSDLRYNFWYPRWAYDRYRVLMDERGRENDWNYLDLWDSIASDQFTDSPVHLTPEGSQQLSNYIRDEIEKRDG
jgi:hypothetical protein